MNEGKGICEDAGEGTCVGAGEGVQARVQAKDTSEGAGEG